MSNRVVQLIPLLVDNFVGSITQKIYILLLRFVTDYLIKYYSCDALTHPKCSS